jgi:UDP-N-acetylmuramyl pentapeptide phosphotransferase/UDP-N-acetylglucosamine-1-phosphate transferase
MNVLFLFLFLIIISIFLNKFLIFASFFLDKNLKKKQAIHSVSIPRSGGFVSMTAILIVIFFNYYVYGIDNINFLPLLFGIFLIGLIDDYGIEFHPLLRLLFLIIVCFIYFLSYNFKLRTTGIGELDGLIYDYNLNFLIITLCFLVLINGSNFIDGINGNLSIHYLCIFFLLSIIIPENQKILLISVTTTLTIFLYYNLKNKIFFGDGGAYLLGSFLGLLIVKSLEDNTGISPFFYLILTAYLGSEVLISFLRRIFSKSNVAISDFNHLHSCLFKIFKNKTKLDAHLLTSISINLFYISFVLPAFFFKDNFEITRNYLIFLYFIYFLFYISIRNISARFK